MIADISTITKLYISSSVCRTSTPSSSVFGDWIDLTSLLSGENINIEGGVGELLYIGSDKTIETSSRMTFNGDTLLMQTAAADKKAFQVKNQNGGLGVVTLFVDSNDHGGFSVEEDGGTTTGFKTRGDNLEHSYFNQRHVSVNRGGSSLASGNGTIGGAVLSVFDQVGATLNAKNVTAISGDSNDYLANFTSRSGTNDEYVGISLGSDTSVNNNQTIGAAIVFEKKGNNSGGNLHIGVKTNTTNLGDLDTALSFTSISGASKLATFTFAPVCPSFNNAQIAALNVTTYEGAIIYNSQTNKHMGCDGTSFNNLY